MFCLAAEAVARTAASAGLASRITGETGLSADIMAVAEVALDAFAHRILEEASLAGSAAIHKLVGAGRAVACAGLAARSFDEKSFAAASTTSIAELELASDTSCTGCVAW